MTEGQMRRPLRGLADLVIAPLVDLHGPLGILEVEPIGMLLVPLETGLGAIDANGEPVLFAGRDLRAPEDAVRAVGEAQEHAGIIIEQATGNEGLDIGTERFYLQPRYVRN